MNTDSDVVELPPCPVLAGFEREDRVALGSYGKFYRFRANETVIGANQSQNRLYLLIRGALCVAHNTRGPSAPLGTIEEGQWFGEINIFDPQKASATVVSAGESHVWSLSRDRLEEYLNENPVLGCLLLLGVGEILAKRARELIARLNATWEISW